ncbi:MAG: hypothetical protein JNM76_02490 [Betaproteobacteria bacterium]|nr:hypothetical protein [Betaproteobacteria bacterium]
MPVPTPSGQQVSSRQGVPIDTRLAARVPWPPIVDMVSHVEPLTRLIRDALLNAGAVRSDWGGDLSRLHSFVEAGDRSHAGSSESYLNAVLRALTRQWDFQRQYHALVAELAVRAVPGEHVFQALPRLRCMLPGPSASARPEAERGKLRAIHADLLWGHPAGQLNVWLPLTDSQGTAALHLGSLAFSVELLQDFLASHPELAVAHDPRALFANYLTSSEVRLAQVHMDCRPSHTQPGFARVFDVRQLYGTAENLEEATSVGLEFRLVPLEIHDRMAGRAADTLTPAGERLVRGAFYSDTLARQATTSTPS